MQIANEFANSWEQYSSNNNFTQEQIRAKRAFSLTEIPYSPDPEKALSFPITLQEFDSTLNSCKGSAPGIDKVTYGMIRKAPTDFKERIVSLYNDCIEKSTFPQAWKNAIQVPIHKRTNSSNTLRDYRPISLLPCLSRVFEKILGKRLRRAIEPLLTSEQHGFRPGRGTTSLLLELENDVAEVKGGRGDAFVLSMDLEKAFDRVGKERIALQLAIWGFDMKFIRLILNFLSHRTFQVRVNGHTSNKRKLDNGLPQGSPLSPVLFNAFIHTLSTRLTDVDGLRHYLYADNVLVLAADENATQQIRRAITYAEAWCRENGALIPRQKTELIRFPSARRPVEKYVEVDGQQIRPQNKCKILGVTFTKNLRWNEHIKAINTKLKRVNNLIKILAAKGKGTRLHSTIRIAKTLTDGTINYGLTLYGTAAATQIKAVQTDVNTILRTATGAYRTTPVEALWVETGQLSVKEKIKKAQTRLIARNVVDPERPHYNTLLALSEGVKQHKSALHMALQDTRRTGVPLPNSCHAQHSPPPPPHKAMARVTIQHLEHLPKSTTPALQYRKLHRRATVLSKDDWTIYTDGSKADGCVSAALVVYHPRELVPALERKMVLHPDATAYEAELVALAKAVDMAIENGKRATIYSDSKAVIKAIENTDPKEAAIKYLRRKLVATNGNVKIAWIPGHVGIMGNELADRLAREKPNPQEEVLTPTLESFIRRYTTRELVEERSRGWRRNGTFLSKHWTTVSPPRYPTEMTRAQAIRLLRLRTGHTRLTHGHYMTRTPQPGCVECQQALTIEHILTDCHMTRRTNLQIPPLKDLLHPENFEQLFEIFRARGLASQI